MFLKRDDPHLLIVGMTGVKMGDRFVQIGCAHGGRLAAVAGKVGLSGRAVLVAPDEAAAERGRKGAENAGVLVEIETAPPTRLPLDADDFDIAIVDDIGRPSWCVERRRSGDGRQRGTREFSGRRDGRC